MSVADPPRARGWTGALLVAASCALTVGYYYGPRPWPLLGYAYVALGALLGRRGLEVLRHRRGWPASLLIAAFWAASSYAPRAYLPAGPLRVLAVLLITAQLAVVIQLLTGALARTEPLRRGRVSRIRWRWLAWYAGVPLAAWATFVLAYAPAKMSFDSYWQWGMAHHITQYNDWHPLLHTWLIEGAARVHDSPLSYIVLQVLLCSAAVAFAMVVLHRLGAPRWVTVTLVLAYAFYPVAGFYAVTMWKDVPFAYLVLASTAMLALVVRTDGAWLRRPLPFGAFLAVGFLTMHVRSNGLPALLLALVVAIVVLRRARRRLLVATAVLLVAHVGWTAVVLPHFHVLSPPQTQALAIPTQQIGATYARGGNVPADLARYYERILPADRWRADYQPYSVDPIKHDPQYRDGVVSQSLGRYVANWVQLLVRNPGPFVAGYLDQTASIWRYSITDARARSYVDSPLDLQTVPVRVRLVAPGATTYQGAVKALYRLYNPRGCSGADPACRPLDRSDCFGEDRCVSQRQFAARVARADAPLTSATPVPQLKSAYDKLLLRLASNAPASLSRGAAPLLVLLLALVVATRRDRRRAVVFAAPLAVLATIAAGMPATDLRYSFGWIVTVPFLTGLALVPAPRRGRALRDAGAGTGRPSAVPAPAGAAAAAS